MTTGREAPSGPPYNLLFPAVAVDSGSIATLTVVETSVACLGAKQNSVCTASPRAALPAGIFLSHCRCAADNAVLVGLGNMTAGPIDPASITFDIAVRLP